MELTGSEAVYCIVGDVQGIEAAKFAARTASVKGSSATSHGLSCDCHFETHVSGTRKGRRSNSMFVQKLCVKGIKRWNDIKLDATKGRISRADCTFAEERGTTSNNDSGSLASLFG